jgi:hypothetical protein
VSTESHELVLYVDNDEPLWRAKTAIFRALAKKKDRRTYDERLAPKAFATLLTNAAKKYVREFGAPGDRWNAIFSPIDRRHGALELVQQFDAWYTTDYPTGG